MRIDKQKEKEFMDSKFDFSYSSMNRLLFCPRIFYKEYILKEKEVRMDKHLIEGSLLHLMLLQPEKLHDEFSIVPGKVPSDSVRKILNDLKKYNNPNMSELDDEILEILKDHNLYQSFKDDSKRLDKIQTPENAQYFHFLLEEGKTVIDNDMLAKAIERVDIIKENKDIMPLFSHGVTDFEMDNLEIHNEKYLSCELKDYKFGLKGFVDRYVIDHDKAEITIIDVKTSGKTISDFHESLDFYKYWLQAAVYSTLVSKNTEQVPQSYKILFKFVVIDKYDQTYAFDVSQATLKLWIDNLHKVLKMLNFHYTECKYELPYEFLHGKVIL
tara:strand:+ start:175 stop:1155 length:981 start_codon:yes stop_codon:yes gene_type:complete